MADLPSLHTKLEHAPTMRDATSGVPGPSDCRTSPAGYPSSGSTLVDASQ